MLQIAAFPDTNQFLHFRPLNEIDWCGFLHADVVGIKIAPVVTRELEEQKTLNPSRKIRERAASALKLLHSYLGQGSVRTGVTLEFLVTEPTAEFALARGLNLQLADDRFVGTLLRYREAHPETSCVLVTGDLPLTVKGTHYQIQMTAPSEALRLPSEPDALEKRNKQIEAELLRYKSREPVLDVRFEGGEGHSRFQIARPIDEASDSEETIKNMLAAAKAKCPLVELGPRQQSEVTIIADSPVADLRESIRMAVESIQGFGQQFYENFNARANAYYRAYEKYLRNTLEFKTMGQRTVQLNLILTNTGTCPAEDIHVLLHFPDGFKLFDENHPPKAPKEPPAPSMETDFFPMCRSFPRFPTSLVCLSFVIQDYPEFARQKAMK